MRELEKLEYYLGRWRLRNWTIREAIVQVGGIHGVYGIICVNTNRIYIGEGILSIRIQRHLSKTTNKQFVKDLEIYGEESIRLLFIVPCNDEVERKILENKLQTYYKDKCYNKIKRQYPTQEELLNDKGIINRLNDYDIDGDCWISRIGKSDKKLRMRFDKKDYKHHTLMYIYHKGDFDGISQVLYTKCKNKLCVNYNHMKLTTYKNTNNMDKNHDDTHDMVNKLHKLDVSKEDIATLMKISVLTVRRNLTNTERKVGVSFNGSVFVTHFYDSGKHLCLGNYDEEYKGLQNRDYYIVRNNRLANKRAQLNYFDVNYHNFTPHKGTNGKINKHLL